jgi:hypothetical protein
MRETGRVVAGASRCRVGAGGGACRGPQPASLEHVQKAVVQRAVTNLKDGALRNEHLPTMLHSPHSRGEAKRVGLGSVREALSRLRGRARAAATL